MASTFGITAPVSTFDDISPSRAHRSRFSIHINTPRVRRWLLVQLVTLPVGDDVDPLDGGPAPDLRLQPEAPPPGVERLLDNYNLEQALRRWA